MQPQDLLGGQLHPHCSRLDNQPCTKDPPCMPRTVPNVVNLGLHCILAWQFWSGIDLLRAYA